MVRVNRGYALAATAWLVLVVVGAVLVWAVISRAGQGVVGQQSPSVEEVAPITSPAEPRRGDRPRTNKPSPKSPSKSDSPRPGGPSGGGTSGPPPPSGTSSPGPAPSSTPSPDPAPGPGPQPGPGPTSSPNPPPSSPPPQQEPPPEDQGVRRTWQGTSGSVTVECRGARIELLGAQPNPGWSIEIDNRGPEEVRVEFDSNDGDRRTRVQAVCVGGTPRFEIDREDD